MADKDDNKKPKTLADYFTGGPAKKFNPAANKNEEPDLFREDHDEHFDDQDHLFDRISKLLPPYPEVVKARALIYTPAVRSLVAATVLAQYFRDSHEPEMIDSMIAAALQHKAANSHEIFGRFNWETQSMADNLQSIAAVDDVPGAPYNAYPISVRRIFIAGFIADMGIAQIARKKDSKNEMPGATEKTLNLLAISTALVRESHVNGKKLSPGDMKLMAEGVALFNKAAKDYKSDYKLCFGQDGLVYEINSLTNMHRKRGLRPD